MKRRLQMIMTAASVGKSTNVAKQWIQGLEL